jgi:hypothetical protein
MSWCEILILITSLTILFKVLQGRYKELHGGKK